MSNGRFAAVFLGTRLTLFLELECLMGASIGLVLEVWLPVASWAGQGLACLTDGILLALFLELGCL